MNSRLQGSWWTVPGLIAFAFALGGGIGARPATAEGTPDPKPAPSAEGSAPGAADKTAKTGAPKKRKLPDSAAEMGELETPPPPFSDGVYPCSDCHNKDREPDPTRREIDQHDFKFEHDAEHRWCFDCHNIQNYDTLHLSGGEVLPFTESYKLCGQCHGDKYRDWRAGVHGRRTGNWDGKKKYLLCVNCHNPHSPKFKPIKPMPPPTRPERLR